MGHGHRWVDPNHKDPDRLYFGEFVERFLEASRVGSRSLWERADIAAEVEITYGQGDLLRLAKEVGEAYSTLKVLRWVAVQFPPETRRLGLSFRHHQTLASREDRFVWLEKAENGKWTVQEMLDEIRGGPTQRMDELVEKVAAPKAPDEYTLREIAALDREDRHKILANADLETTAEVSGERGLTREEAIGILNWWMINQKELLLKMDLLEFVNALFVDIGSIDYDNETETFELGARNGVDSEEFV